jgi:fumarylacetoacetate (FAA) hydrolase
MRPEMVEDRTVKLASLARGGRDGTLIVVDRDIRRGVEVPDIAGTLREAIENWDRLAGDLVAVAKDLEAGRVTGDFLVDPRELASPLPRAFQFLDGSVYLHHMEKARRARGAEMPANYESEPIMYQGLSDGFVGPRQSFPVPDEQDEIDYEAEIGVVLDDVPLGTPASAAAEHIKLVVLLNDWTLRGITKYELPRGFGFVQAKPTSSFGPVAVTLDELEGGWDGERFHLQVSSAINGRVLGRAAAGEEMFFSYPELIAHAARTRNLSAGTIIGAGSISNLNPDAGYGCIAEARVGEQAQGGSAVTDFLSFGDVVTIDAVDGSGRSVFGTIENTVERASAVRAPGGDHA